jgi:hypothetical protein
MIRGDPSLAAKFVRLAFNDCIGGCDGCVDLQHPKNYGLDHPIFALQHMIVDNMNMNIYHPHPSSGEEEDDSSWWGLSRADIWALAALTGSEMSQGGSDRITFDMKWFGRIDCEHQHQQTCRDKDGQEVECSATRGSHRNIPDPNLTTRQLLQWFQDEFAFDTDEAVALMGAHSLGRKRQFNSGYDGPSTTNEYRLDNEYYTQLMMAKDDSSTIWHQAQIYTDSTPVLERWQWMKHAAVEEEENNISLAMFTVDMGLLWDLEGYVEDSGRVVCDLVQQQHQEQQHEQRLHEPYMTVTSSSERNHHQQQPPLCPHASMTLSLMERYRDDTMLWLYDFSDVLGRLLVHGYNMTHECTTPPCLLLKSNKRESISP